MHSCTTEPVAIEATGVKTHPLTLTNPDAQGHRLATVEGLPLDVDAQGTPRARDPDLAEFLGFKRPRKVRDLIRRHETSGLLGAVDWRPTVGRIEKNQAGSVVESRETLEAWLTEEQALLLAAKSETDRARAMLQAIVRVFVAVRHGLLPPPAPAAPLALSPASGDAARVDRLEREMRLMKEAVGRLARRTELAALERQLASIESLQAFTLAAGVQPSPQRPAPMPLTEALVERVWRYIQTKGLERFTAGQVRVKARGDRTRASGTVAALAVLVGRGLLSPVGSRHGHAYRVLAASVVSEVAL